MVYVPAGAYVARHHLPPRVVQNGREVYAPFGVVHLNIPPVAPILLAGADANEVFLAEAVERAQARAIRRAGEAAARPVGGVELHMLDARDVVCIGAMDAEL